MFCSKTLRALNRRSDANWTFNTRFPDTNRTRFSDTNRGKRRNQKLAVFPKKPAPKLGPPKLATYRKTQIKLPIPSQERLRTLSNALESSKSRAARTGRLGQLSSPKAGDSKLKSDLWTKRELASSAVASTLTGNGRDSRLFKDQVDRVPAPSKESLQAIETASFNDFDILPALRTAIFSVLGSGARPTPVQALAVPASLKIARFSKQNNALLIGAETGSGKTLAYLIPLIHRLKMQELRHQQESVATEESGNTAIEAIIAPSKAAFPTAPSSLPDSYIARTSPEDHLSALQPSTKITHAKSSLRKLRRPRAVILVPSRDLVLQVTTTLKSLCTHTPNLRLTSLGIHARASHRDRIAFKLATTPIDILISTPTELLKHIDKVSTASSFAVNLSRVTDLILDESDTLHDDSNLAATTEIQSILASQSTPHETTPTLLTTYISATFPTHMTKHISSIFPSHIRVTTPSLHHPSTGLRTIKTATTQSPIKHTFLRITPSSPRQNLLTNTLKRAAQSKQGRILIFVNSRDTGTQLTETLRTEFRGSNVAVLFVSGDVCPRVRDAAVKLFRVGGSETLRPREWMGLERISRGESWEFSGDVENDVWEAWKERTVVLVATDVASRGVDTTLAEHVVMYEFPKSVVEYLHRAGRVGRMGGVGKGRVTSFIGKKDVKLAEQIEVALRKKNAL